jgi:hypothetical protein
MERDLERLEIRQQNASVSLSRGRSVLSICDGHAISHHILKSLGCFRRYPASRQERHNKDEMNICWFVSPSVRTLSLHLSSRYDSISETRSVVCIWVVAGRFLRSATGMEQKCPVFADGSSNNQRRFLRPRARAPASTLKDWLTTPEICSGRSRTGLSEPPQRYTDC